MQLIVMQMLVGVIFFTIYDKCSRDKKHFTVMLKNKFLYQVLYMSPSSADDISCIKKHKDTH